MRGHDVVRDQTRRRPDNLLVDGEVFTVRADGSDERPLTDSHPTRSDTVGNIFPDLGATPRRR